MRLLGERRIVVHTTCYQQTPGELILLQQGTIMFSGFC